MRRGREALWTMHGATGRQHTRMPRASPSLPTSIPALDRVPQCLRRGTVRRVLDDAGACEGWESTLEEARRNAAVVRGGNAGIPPVEPTGGPLEGPGGPAGGACPNSSQVRHRRRGAM
jgi:hypothetical protein